MSCTKYGIFTLEKMPNRNWIMVGEVRVDTEAVSKVIFPRDQFRLGKWQSLRELDRYSCSVGGGMLPKVMQSEWRQAHVKCINE